MTIINQPDTETWLDHNRNYLFGFSLWISIATSGILGTLHFIGVFQYNSTQLFYSAFIFLVCQSVVLTLFLKKTFPPKILIWAAFIFVQLYILLNIKK